MELSKGWWQSRTIWVNVVAVLYAIAATFKIIPAGMAQEDIVTAIMGVIGTVTIVLRFFTKQPLG